MVAQLLYNSAGQLVLGNQLLLAYLLFSAVCSTVAFALFEISTIFQLHDLMSLDATIKAEIDAHKLIRRGYVVLAISSLINFVSVLYFLALAWHTTGGHGAAFPLDDLPQPWNWAYYGLHALAYTAVLFLAGIFGERPKSAKEVVLATQRGVDPVWWTPVRLGCSPEEVFRWRSISRPMPQSFVPRPFDWCARAGDRVRRLRASWA